jgi:nitronate monooxygenase
MLWRATYLSAADPEMGTLTSRPFGQLDLDFSAGRSASRFCLQAHGSLISFSGAIPLRWCAGKASGAISSCGFDIGAKRAVDCGVDIVIAQGWEAGGHVRGMVATMPLVPAVVDAVSPTPVVAAGGIADGRGLAAALALGAAGAWIGTRFLASEEAAIHPRYRELVLQANENDTVYLDPVRCPLAGCAPSHPEKSNSSELGGGGSSTFR